MCTILQNLTSLLELPGLSNLVNGYTKTCVKVNENYMNRKQFQSIKHYNTITVFSYGHLNLLDPKEMFYISEIKTFTSKGTISLTGDANYMFFDAKSFNSDLSRWNVENVVNMACMFNNAISFNSDISRWNVEKVENMACMFNDAISFNSDISRWNVKEVRSNNRFYTGAISFDIKLSPKF